MRMKKYEITDIAHPDNPKLHRIRALMDLTENIHAGELGGYVEREENLSQQGFAWIGEEAIACENAFIDGNAVLTGSAFASGCSYIANNAVITGNAEVQDNAIVCGGNVFGNSRICGNAFINSEPQTLCAPRISDHARVYGEIIGNVICKGSTVVLPGIRLYNTTKDCFILQDNKARVVPAQRQEIVAPTAPKETKHHEKER